MEINNSTQYNAMSLKASYAQTTLQGEFEVNGKKIQGELSFTEINFEFSMVSSGISGLGSLGQSGLSELSDFFSKKATTKTEDKIRDFLKKVDEGMNGLSLEKLGYTGKALSELSQDEAKSLVSDEGFFGISQTSARIANFVIKGSGDNLERLKAGREGALQGFKQAEEMWGEKLPDIAYKTIEKALKEIDDRINELGGHILETTS